MNAIVIGIAATAGAIVSHLALPLLAQSGAVQRPVQAPAVAPATTDDARRAAAQRLLQVSRFRARQDVHLGDTLQAAQADLQADCLDRAADGRALTGCDATARPDPGAAARLQAARPQILDEIMIATQTVYAQRLTVAEMDEMARFFRTPVGQKYSTLYPQMIADVEQRKHAIVRRYFVAASRPPARRRP
jgi:uncharacterized protein